MRNFYLLLFMVLSVSLSAQQTVSGTIMDEDLGEPLIGATVMEKGTTNGTLTDVEGNFSFEVTSAEGMLVVSYVGMDSKEFNFGGASGYTLSSMGISGSAFGLSEVVITGVMDIVQDRMTPVAVSTITTQEIQAKGGNVEFPDLLKSTPSIYVANQSGGYGDSEVFTRGFDQTNTAFLLNGQPINGMEDGKMYWSNWSGMTDVATAVQVQRGLGSSKLAISSVGGTTNIVMKATDQRKGGTASFLYGNDNYMKATASYSTGMMNDKFGMTVLLTHWQGDGWSDGTAGQGQNYFISAGYKANERNELNFLLTGAPQWHDQNFDKSIFAHENEDGEFNPKYNFNWGTLDGEEFTWRRNYYHKPVANLNWDFSINEKSKLSTVLYASWGRGGGTGPLGGFRAPNDENGQVDFDAIVENNSMFSDPSSGDIGIRRASVNNHSWYGLVSNYETALTDDWTFSMGADLRTYRGDHFRQVIDLFGAPHYPQWSVRYDGVTNVSSTFEANPWSALTNYAKGDERIAYSNAERISYGGLFGQLEYANDNISTYIQAAASTQAYTRFEQFYATVEDEKSETVNNIGFNVKGGASFSFEDNGILFFNAGYYSRQPFFDNIFLNFTNVIKPGVENEGIFGLEGGYKFQSNRVALNLNVYHTFWTNRLITESIRDGETVEGIEFPNGGFINLTDLNQLHQGVEVDFSYRHSRHFTLKGFGSLGNWVYDGTATRDIYDDERNLVNSVQNFNINGVHVGGAAQTSVGVGMEFTPINKLSIDLDYFHYSRLYSKIGASTDELELPKYSLIDAGVSYAFSLPSNRVLRLRANMFNVLDNIYISQSRGSLASVPSPYSGNFNGYNKANTTRFGRGRTWNVSLRYQF